MFVGVGASRVRDLFQTARKQAPAIIFVDEIDSIGRKRGAGLGGGHDEREQTLNQMLSEMDGFDVAEGIVDHGRDQPARHPRPCPAAARAVSTARSSSRSPTSTSACRSCRCTARTSGWAPTWTCRSSPAALRGCPGADLANLVNEAALHAVRRGSQFIEMRDFDAARDRILMGQPRDSLVLSELEKARVAFHEGGHAVLAYVLPHADPLLKVSIIPTGLALGVTQQLPTEERHIYPREYIEDALVVRMGGRVAEMLIYGDLSTGASDDLQRNTELARKMVREWGMSERVGPMAWGSQGMVFLGEDLMHTRDYSEDTSRVVDEEVARILREQEARATAVLREHRAGLEAVAHALLEFETVDGAEIARLDRHRLRQARARPAEGEEKLATERYAPSLSGWRHGRHRRCRAALRPGVPTDRRSDRTSRAARWRAQEEGDAQGEIGIAPSAVVWPWRGRELLLDEDRGARGDLQGEPCDVVHDPAEVDARARVPG